MRQSSRITNVMSLLGGFVAVAMTMGVLGACLVLPAVGVAGQATNNGIRMFNQMPGDFAMNPLAQQSRILAADGSLIGTPFNENRIVVPLSKIAPVMRNAQIAIEDERFYEHGGVDAKGLLRAISSNVMSGGTQGASTLTQQYVKVALQNQALASGNKDAAAGQVTQQGMQGYVRKLQQLKYAVSLEQKYTKDQILDGYLNLVYFGDQQYGIEAASLHYFGKHASQLALPEAALLAGVVNAPGVTDPVNNPEAAVKRRNLVLTKMHQQGMISYADYNSASNSKLQLKLTNVSSSCASSPYPYFCYYVYDWLLEQPSLGDTRKQREAKLKGGGLTIQTSFDPKIAKIIDKQIKAKVPVANPAGVQAAGIVVQPGTGLVLGSAQNTQYSNTGATGKSAINYTTPLSMGGGQGFTFGSTAKFFAVIDAVKNGWTYDSKIDVPPMNGVDKVGTFRKFTSKEFPGECGLGAETWRVGNSEEDAGSGQQSLVDVTAKSINVAFAQLVSQLGACNVRQTMIDFGLKAGDGSPINKTPSGIVLGSQAVTALDLANSYATIAADGKHCQPRPVKSIADANGKPLKLTGTECKQLVSPDVARTVTKIFESVLEPGGTASDAALAGKRPSAGKTGTVDTSTQTWFVGYTPQMATAVWVGHADNEKPLKNVRLAGKTYPGYLYGGTLAAPLWKSIMDEALKGQPVKQFGEPSDAAMKGEQVRVPNVVGQSPDNARTLLEAAGFEVKQGDAQDSRMFAGRIMGTSPRVGTKAPKGSTVTIFPSTGRAARAAAAAPRVAAPPVVKRTAATTKASKPSATPSSTSAPKPSSSSKPPATPKATKPNNSSSTKNN
ncbi:penicillin-binding protein [Yimella sp. cx-573]|nr:penicillin-binding protein [Yimella sp. cx-573]